MLFFVLLLIKGNINIRYGVLERWPRFLPNSQSWSFLKIFFRLANLIFYVPVCNVLTCHLFKIISWNLEMKGIYFSVIVLSCTLLPGKQKTRKDSSKECCELRKDMGKKKLEAGSSYFIYRYHTRAIITRGLYIFYPLFEVQKRFFQGAFFLKFWPYVWLVFKSGF